MTSPTEAFRTARDLLLDLRGDHEAAAARFRWPRPERFNWALDWFDRVAAGSRRPAVVLVDRDGGTTRVSYAELAERSDRVANHLRTLGVGRGDRLLLMLDNRIEVWEALLAAIKLGAVLVPTYTSITGPDLADRLHRAGVRYVLTDDRLAERFAGELAGTTVLCAGERLPGRRAWADAYAAPAAFQPDGETAAEDPLFLYFTSGTTAAPKMVLHTHSSYPIGHLTGMYWNGLRPGDVHANVSAPGWAKHAWSSVFGPFNAEATVLSVDGPAERLPAVLGEQRATGLCAPPTVWRTLVRAGLGGRPAALREACAVGEPLEAEVIERVRAAWGVTVRDGYGQTEMTAAIGATPGLTVRPGAMGLALPGYRILLLDPATGRPAEEGEICVDLTDRPAGLMAGYLGDPERTAAAFAGGRYRTGDFARRGPDGQLVYVGRRDEVFKSFDHRISPFELESVLLAHPEVAEAAVVPAPHPVGLYVPKAYVTPAPGSAADHRLARSVLGFAAERLAPHQRIAAVEFAAGLPRTTSGKVRRAELRAAGPGRQFHAEQLLGADHTTRSAPGLGPATTPAKEHPMTGNEHRPQQRPVEVLPDLFGDGLTDGRIEWRPYLQPGREAVDVRWLYTGEETGPDGAEAYLAHFRPGAHGDLHRHLGFELMLVLDGELVNDNGDRYGPGALVVERPGSVHRVSSPDGCKMLVVREKRTVPLLPGEQPDTGLALDGSATG